MHWGHEGAPPAHGRCPWLSAVGQPTTAVGPKLLSWWASAVAGDRQARRRRLSLETAGTT